MKCPALLALACVLLWSIAPAFGQTHDIRDMVKRVNAAADVLEQIMTAPDSSIPREILDGAECIVITPSMFKAGIGMGGRYTKGVASCRTNGQWSAPAPYTVAGGGWGLQFGAQAVDLVMLIMNEHGLHNLLSSKLKIGADVSAAGPVGRHVAAGTDWKIRAQILTYSRSRGIFTGVALNGVAVKQDKNDTRILYGRMVPFEGILKGKVRAPKSAQKFISSLSRHAPFAKTERARSSDSRAEWRDE